MLKTELICCVQLSFQVLIGVDQNIEEPLVICSYLCVERSSICCIVSRAFIVALHPFLASKKLACAIQFSLTHLLACMSKLSSLWDVLSNLLLIQRPPRLSARDRRACHCSLGKCCIPRERRQEGYLMYLCPRPAALLPPFLLNAENQWPCRVREPVEEWFVNVYLKRHHSFFTCPIACLQHSIQHWWIETTIHKLSHFAHFCRNEEWQRVSK